MDHTDSTSTTPGPAASQPGRCLTGPPATGICNTGPMIFVSTCSSHVATDCGLTHIPPDGSHDAPQVGSPGHTPAHGFPAPYKREAAGSTPAAPTRPIPL